MRLTRLSLAAKYRVLFGAAVLLIIGAALSVPWLVIQRLVVQQPYREAESLSNRYFMTEIHSGSRLNRFNPSALSEEFSLLTDRATPEPRFVRPNPDFDDPESLSQAENQTAFVARAFRRFVRDPGLEQTYAIERIDGGGRFSYAHAIRVERRCLSCHSEGRGAPAFRNNELAGIITLDIPIASSDAQLFYYRWWMVAAGLLAGILAILVFYIITHRFILSPIHELNDVALSVTAGNLEQRATLQTGDEFETLSENINTMLERLRSSQLELRNANRLLDQKLGEMAETNVALYEANRVKSEFIANVSHELRTPLTSIIGFAELLRESGNFEPGDKVPRYAENILISGRILLEIINDLLDLAKIEAGKVELQIESVNVINLCRTLLDFVRPLADKKRLMLRLVVDPDAPPLETDRGRLRQILYNFLSNAIKFTPEGGRITVSIRMMSEGKVRLAVADTGPGISPENQSAIFEKFRQIDQSETREHPGTGLGLAIAKELAGLLGGSVGVESTPGAGATFWVVLPPTTPRVREREPMSLI